MIIVAIYLLAFFATIIFFLGIRARLRSKQSISSHTLAPTIRMSSAAKNAACAACNGSGFATQPSRRSETKWETKMEFFTDSSGRPRTRTTTQPKTSIRTEIGRKVCPICGGSGRRPNG